MWVLNAETHEVRPLIEQRRHLEQCGMELFTSRGRVAVHYSWRFHARALDWVHMDVFINHDGSDPQSFRYPYMTRSGQYGRPGHTQVAWGDETLGAGDANIQLDETGNPRNCVVLIRYRDEMANVKVLCGHDSSWETLASHPHPIFSRDDRWVYFVSDRDGRANVYRVPVPAE
jgi:oligogalacturonide lyase